MIPCVCMRVVVYVFVTESKYCFEGYEGFSVGQIYCGMCGHVRVRVRVYVCLCYHTIGQY